MTDTLAELLQAQLRAATFTHAYAACGFLAEPQPRYCYSHLPAARSIFDLASLTKALVTLPLYVQAELSGQLHLADPIATLLQGSEHKLHATLARLPIIDLLAHRSGLPAWRNFWLGTLGKAHVLSAAEVIAMLNRTAPQLQDRQPHYSDLNYILAGICLEIWRKKSLATLFAELCHTQLHYVPRLCFGFCPETREQAVPTAYCHIRERLLQGEVHDENCAARGGVSGHAGLFGSGDDLVTYLRALCQHEVGREILRRNDSMLRAQDSSPLSSSASLRQACLPLASSLFGMQRGADGVLSTRGMLLGHLGFTGTSFWLDPQSGGYYVLLTNRTIKARLLPEFHALRQQVFKLLQKELNFFAFPR